MRLQIAHYLGLTRRGGGKAVGKFNDDLTDALPAKLRAAKSPSVQPFEESIDKTNWLYNKPQRLLVDAEYVYLVPEWREEERRRSMQAMTSTKNSRNRSHRFYPTDLA
jgi:hypothetical protein